MRASGATAACLGWRQGAARRRRPRLQRGSHHRAQQAALLVMARLAWEPVNGPREARAHEAARFGFPPITLRVTVAHDPKLCRRRSGADLVRPTPAKIAVGYSADGLAQTASAESGARADGPAHAAGKQAGGPDGRSKRSAFHSRQRTMANLLWLAPLRSRRCRNRRLSFLTNSCPTRLQARSWWRSSASDRSQPVGAGARVARSATPDQ